ncbi:MAG: hypothetical protein LBS11_05300 [Oscillospiraceae bacterium]|jgi:cell wall-associated NlpC family hydrolase|nr:hypothetical protein [Oscillospiraceae bacterium]
MSVNGSTVAQIAIEWAAVSPSIPYVPNGSTRKGADCQGFVEGCAREAGGLAKYYRTDPTSLMIGEGV